MESKIAWSEKQDKKRKKLERKRKKDLKASKSSAEEVNNEDEDSEIDDLDEDYRLLKKMKRVRTFSFSLLFCFNNSQSNIFPLFPFFQKKSKASQEDFDRQIELENVEDDIE